MCKREAVIYDPAMHESALSSLPVVHSLGTTLFDPCWAERAHASGSCELLYVTRGAVELVLGAARYPAGAGDLLFIPSGAAHRDDFDPAQGLQVFMVFFSWPGEGAFNAHVTNDRIRAMSPVRKREVVRMLERLRGDVLSDSLADQLVVRARLLTVLLLLLREAQTMTEHECAPGKGPANRERRRGLMLAAQAYLDRHYDEPISLEKIADALQISTFYLSHVFTQERNFSLFAYLTNLRMERARALLREGKLNVSEVARAVGYDSGNYFAKVFRKHFGHPPSDLLGIPAPAETDSARIHPK